MLFILMFSIALCNNLYNSFAADVEFPSSPNPVGSGARAMGMGGAFIAVADDATAASWNPAGLTWLERPEISFVGALFHRTEDNTYGKHPEGSGIQTVSDSNINYFSVAYPFEHWGRKMIVSISHQHLYDFSREWDFFIEGENEVESWRTDYDHDLEGSLSAVGIAYCIRFNPQFSFGCTLNIWDDGASQNEWENRYASANVKTAGDGSYIHTSDSYSLDRYSFSGLNANFGLLWKVNWRLSIGAVLKLPFKADLRHEHASYSVSQYSDSSEPTVEPLFYAADETMDMPMSCGIGFAYRFSDVASASLDIYRTEWDDFILTNSNGKQESPITRQSPADSDVDPTHQIRMGAEYLFISPKSNYLIPVRGGIFYDPAPAEGNPDDFFGFSIGSGIAYINRKKDKPLFSFDIAYQCRFGNNVGASFLKGWGFSQDVREHTVYSSVIIYF
ncbi:MAG: hypothetical protein DRI57_03525 [Deltaproteobacteria bacterium]|nr:MAG: hypothetical protein DRI57_03525 [Deltaproteobacteria bacterium]